MKKPDICAASILKFDGLSPCDEVVIKKFNILIKVSRPNYWTVFEIWYHIYAS